MVAVIAMPSVGVAIAVLIDDSIQLFYLYYRKLMMERSKIIAILTGAISVILAIASYS
ncbi:hypothetical protein [Nostoc sp.]|uniref:hypothetical protein n=2 Tax=Nostoc sp. TaxID=1180 RepID=UPI002FF79514